MKRIPLQIMILLLSLSFSSIQAQCKWKNSEIDPFTGKKKLSSKVFLIYQEYAGGVTSDRCEMQLLFENDMPKINVRYLVHPATNEETISNLKIELKLSNGETLSWKEFSNFTSGIVCCYATDFKFNVNLSNSEVKSLSENLIVGGRFSFNTYEHTFSIRKKDAEKFLEKCLCLKQEL